MSVQQSPATCLDCARRLFTEALPPCLQVEKEAATKYGCIVTNTSTNQAVHYVEKPDSYISNTINTGVYLFDKSIFDEIKLAMDETVRRAAEDPLLSLEKEDDEQLRLEQDVIAPLASEKKLYVYMTQGFWRQIKSAGSVIALSVQRDVSSSCAPLHRSTQIRCSSQRAHARLVQDDQPNAAPSTLTYHLCKVALCTPTQRSDHCRALFYR